MKKMECAGFPSSQGHRELGARGRAKQNKWFWYFMSKQERLKMNIINLVCAVNLCCAGVSHFMEFGIGWWNLVRYAVTRTEWYLLWIFNVRCKYSHKNNQSLLFKRHCLLPTFYHLYLVLTFKFKHMWMNEFYTEIGLNMRFLPIKAQCT